MLIQPKTDDVNRYSTYDVVENGYSITFYQGDIAVARRDVFNKSIVYIEDIQLNWILEVLTTEHFTLEERLRA